MIFGKKTPSVLVSSGKTGNKYQVSGSGILKSSSRAIRFAEEEFGLSKDKFSFLALALTFLAILLQVSLILFNWGKLPPQLPLFYSRPWGEEILASPVFLWILPALVFIFSAVNFWLLLFFKENIFLRRVIFIFTLIFAFICSYAMTRLMFLIV